MKLGSLILLAMIGTVSSLLIACGGGDDDGNGDVVATPDASGVIEIIARDVKFVPENVVVPAGEMVELRLKNEDGQEHDLQVTDLEVEVMGGGATGAEHDMETPADGMETPAQGESPSGEMGPLAMHTTANGEDSIMFIATEKGTYELWCTITGHKDAGMVGTLTVE